MPANTTCLLQASADFGRCANSFANFDALLTHLMSVICAQFDVQFSSFLELLPDGGLVLRAGTGWCDEIVSRLATETANDAAASHVIRALSPLVVCDSRSDEGALSSPLLREHGILSTLMVPLLSSTRPLGVLGAHGTSVREFSGDEIAGLQLLAELLAARLERDQMGHSQNSEKLLRAEQMMAIGQVAAGVAHELRNPLTSIKGLIQVNLRELGSRGIPTADLTVIEHEIRRMERTLQTFLDFARPPQPDRKHQTLVPIVERVLALVGGRARKQHVELKIQQSKSSAQVEVDGDQIQQLLLNLVLNSLDAMPQGGTLEVEVGLPSDDQIEVAVRDTGNGISPLILPKVFETFVSSKVTGVGLGLPLSRRIAEDHGGSLRAYNLPMQGACFVLRLPVAAP